MDKEKLVSYLRHSRYSFFLQGLYNRLFPVRGKNNVIIGNQGGGKIRIIGNDNIVEIKEHCRLNKIPITILGNGNEVVLNENVNFISSNILCDGTRCKIEIGRGTSIQGAHINAQEHSEIKIGRDCMFSGNIIIRTSDSHPIYDALNAKRLNPAKSVMIGDHVWLGVPVFVLKGVTIGDNSIIGTGSIVTHDIPANCVAVGNPARVVKEGVNWDKSLDGYNIV